MKILLLTSLLLMEISLHAQQSDLDSKLYEGYEKFQEKSVTVRRTKHVQIQPLIDKMKKYEGFEVHKLGESIEGRSISLISVGTGDVDILLWSQMHGDEPTATMAIFDIFNFLTDKKELKKEKNEMLKNVRLHFIPMLNPDGAEKYKRRNALNIDINRDALRLQSSESKILKMVRDSLDAEFGFNLHDQSIYYNADRTSKPATISYLAPAYNYEKSINEVRGNAMKVIVHMNKVIQRYAPGQVGRYSDDFEPRAFGDNIQKWGTSAILIESGGYANDPEKQTIRKLNYISILSAIFAISSGEYQNSSIEDYEKIPNNDRKLFDLKIENMTYHLLGKDYTIDLGINRKEIDNEDHTSFHSIGEISDIGDLSTFYGYQTINAKGLSYGTGEVLVQDGLSYNSLSNLNFDEILKKGMTTIKLDALPDQLSFSPYPINLTLSAADINKELKTDMPATFVLKEKGAIRYAIINGFIYDVNKKTNEIKNGTIR
jgi:hypothetical protein